MAFSRWFLSIELSAVGYQMTQLCILRSSHFVFAHETFDVEEYGSRISSDSIRHQSACLD